MKRLLLASLLLAACKNYDGVLAQCINNGHCINDIDGGSDVVGLDILSVPAADQRTFGLTPIGGMSGPTYLYLRANSPPLTISAMSITGGFGIADDAGCNDLVFSDHNSQCQLEVTFVPTSKSDGDGGLHFETSQGPVDIPFYGTAARVSLALDDTSRDFVVPYNASASQPNSLTRLYEIINTGDVPIPSLSIYANDPDGGWSASAGNTCSLPLAFDAGSCQLRVTFTPTRSGSSNLTVPIQATIGGTLVVPFDFTGHGAQRRTLEIFNFGDAIGSVTVTPYPNVTFPIGAHTTVGPFDVPDPSTLTLVEQPDPGYGFGGWDGGGCSSGASCQLTISGVGTYTQGVYFDTPNPIFQSAAALAPPFDLATADGLCLQEAQQRGLTVADAGDFVAVLTGDGGTARSRLGSARGFGRVDNAPLADTADDLLAGRLWNTLAGHAVPLLDDAGVNPAATFWTGALLSCGGWSQTDSTDAGSVGYSAGDSQDFTAYAPASCSESHTLLCVGTTRTLVMAPPAAPRGLRLAFVTQPTFSAVMSDAEADAECRAEAADAGLVGIAGSPFSAFRRRADLSTLFTTTGNGDWERVDGVPAAGQNELLLNAQLTNPLSVTAHGDHLPFTTRAWVGFRSDGGVEDCGGWNQATGNALVLRVSAATPPEEMSCNARAALICLQQ